MEAPFSAADAETIAVAHGAQQIRAEFGTDDHWHWECGIVSLTSIQLGDGWYPIYDVEVTFFRQPRLMNHGWQWKIHYQVDPANRVVVGYRTVSRKRI